MKRFWGWFFRISVLTVILLVAVSMARAAEMNSFIRANHSLPVHAHAHLYPNFYNDSHAYAYADADGYIYPGRLFSASLFDQLLYAHDQPGYFL